MCSLLKHKVDIHFYFCICAFCYNLRAFIKIQIKKKKKNILVRDGLYTSLMEGTIFLTVNSLDILISEAFSSMAIFFFFFFLAMTEFSSIETLDILILETLSNSLSYDTSMIHWRTDIENLIHLSIGTACTFNGLITLLHLVFTF